MGFHFWGPPGGPYFGAQFDIFYTKGGNIFEHKTFLFGLARGLPGACREVAWNWLVTTSSDLTIEKNS